MWVRTLTETAKQDRKDHLTFLPWYVRIAVWALAVSVSIGILLLVK